MEFRAVYKKATGVAKLTEVGLEWTNGTLAEHIPWASVTNHQYSPASHAKAMMKLPRASASAGAFVLEILGEPGGATPREVLERVRDRVNALRERLSGGGGGGGGGSASGGAPPDAAAAAARKAKALEGDDGAVADSQAARGRTGWRDPQGGARGAGGASGRRLDAVGETRESSIESSSSSMALSMTCSAPSSSTTAAVCVMPRTKSCCGVRGLDLSVPR